MISMHGFTHNIVYVDSENKVIGYNVSICRQLKNGRWVALTQYQCAVDLDTLNIIKEELGLVKLSDDVQYKESKVIDDKVFVFETGVSKDTVLLYKASSTLSDDDFLETDDSSIFFLKGLGVKLVNSFEEFSKIMIV